MPPKKTCIIIAGPTAVGKTGIAIKLAQHFKTAIISADSRQCYKELNIGVARPSLAELALVKHYFINSHSVTGEMNAGIFEQYALKAVHDIFVDHDTAIMVGGTGLYIKAFCEGMDMVPMVSATLRSEITGTYNREGLAWLQSEVKEKDPAWFGVGEIYNPQRLMRALEVVMTTGNSILAYQTDTKVRRDFTIIKIGLTLPRPNLYQQVNDRVEAMLEDGLVDEVRSLLDFRSLNALQTVGYNEIFDFLDKKVDLATAVENIKRNTRNYAKRQLTWFGKDAEIKWFSPLDYSQLINSFPNLV